MTLKLDVYSSICETKEFEINGVPATYKDFGEKYDACPDETRPHCCGNMKFKEKSPDETVLDKYSITVYEYEQICSCLKKKVSFGLCTLCA